MDRHNETEWMGKYRGLVEKIIRLGMADGSIQGVEILRRPVSTVENGYVRHNPGHLARELILLHAERSVRIAGNRFNFREDTYQVEEKR